MSEAAHRLVVATSFPVWPPRGGGQARIFGLYSALARLGVEVDIVALAARGERRMVRTIAPGVRELRIPKSAEHHDAEIELQQRAGGVPVTDIALALYEQLTPAYGDALRAAAADAAAVVASHPFAQPALASCAGVPLIYESHNVEADLKASMLAGSDACDELVDVVRRVEGDCCEFADHVTVCTARDAERLDRLYSLESSRVVTVPNGVDGESVPFTDVEERARRKSALGLGGRFQALFLGSWHEPNIVAVRDTIAAARLLPDARFLVVGSAGLAVADEPRPPNVDLCGIVDSGFVRSLLAVADAALNPMRWGSGSNLKMLDYALAGVPLLSTEFGARGLGLNPGRDYLAFEPDGLAAALEELREEPRDATARRVTSAYVQVRERFLWPAIAGRWRAHPSLGGLLDGARVSA